MAKRKTKAKSKSSEAAPAVAKEQIQTIKIGTLSVTHNLMDENQTAVSKDLAAVLRRNSDALALQSSALENNAQAVRDLIASYSGFKPADVAPSILNGVNKCGAKLS